MSEHMWVLFKHIHLRFWPTIQSGGSKKFKSQEPFFYYFFNMVLEIWLQKLFNCSEVQDHQTSEEENN